MNIRVENSNLPEITKANKVETKGTASAKAQEEQAAQAEKAAARTQGVQQTMVDAPHRAGLPDWKNTAGCGKCQGTAYPAANRNGF